MNRINMLVAYTIYTYVHTILTWSRSNDNNNRKEKHPFHLSIFWHHISLFIWDVKKKKTSFHIPPSPCAIAAEEQPNPNTTYMQPHIVCCFLLPCCDNGSPTPDLCRPFSLWPQFQFGPSSCGLLCQPLCIIGGGDPSAFGSFHSWNQLNDPVVCCLFMRLRCGWGDY